MTIDRFAPPERAAGSGDLLVFARAGRSTALRLPRHGAAVLAALVVLSFAWSAASGVYVVFRDAVLAEIRHGAQATAKGYQAQIADLKTEIERARTRHMVEQAGAAERLTVLVRRQEALERRQGLLAGLAAPGSGAASSDVGLTPARALSYSAKPTPLDRPTTAFDGLDDAPRRDGSVSSDTLSSAIDRLETEQAAALEAAGARTGDRRRKLMKIYDSIGVEARETSETGGRGGPFEPLAPRARTFEARAEQIAAEQTDLIALRRGLDAVPLRSPAPVGSSVSSGFGSRLDPFLRQPAFHAGLDFESEAGRPIRATAMGTVVAAGWSGGYGQMVEVDHGRGLTTRFGHMSAISVHVGQRVGPGAILGRVGSTGRSTGPHLHYETRIDGEPVNPMRFLKAGQSLAAID